MPERPFVYDLFGSSRIVSFSVPVPNAAGTQAQLAWGVLRRFLRGEIEGPIRPFNWRRGFFEKQEEKEKRKEKKKKKRTAGTCLSKWLPWFSPATRD
jgi:hypothetical protein